VLEGDKEDGYTEGNNEMNAGASAPEPAGESVKTCPTCGAEVTDYAPYCWKCGKALPDVLETSSLAPLDERSLMDVELELESEREHRPLERFRSVIAWVWLACALLITVTYELRIIEILVTGQYSEDMIDRVSGQKLRSFAIFTLALLLLSAIFWLGAEIRSKSWLNTLFVCIIVLGLLSLILENLNVVQVALLRPVAMLVTALAFLAWQGPKVARKFLGAGGRI
jgi:hypothetical protein